MKKIIIVSVMILAAAFLSGSSYAAKYRVNNSGVDADFLQPQAAHDAASDGDTLYIEGSQITYNAITLTKRLVIIGTGYFLNENDSTQANPSPSVIAQVVFYYGSANSIMTGISVDVPGITIYNDNILLKRIYCNGPVNISEGDNVSITGSYIRSVNLYSVVLNLNLTNSVLFNPGNDINLSMYADCSAVVKNNVFKGYHYIYNTLYENNIYENSAAAFSAMNSTLKKNICAGTQYDTTGGNLQNIDMTTVFEYTGSTDGQFALKDGSPATGYGVNGVDCGIFGGPAPYVLSGMPTIPAIWWLEVNGINVTVKAKSH